MLRPYDNHIVSASVYTTFALDAEPIRVQSRSMRTAADILQTLKERGVTQTQIANVLGVQQPNVSTLYKPAKNGKPRKLGYDEALQLIKAFNLDAPNGRPRPWLPNGTTYETLMEVLAPFLLEARASPASILTAARVLEGVIVVLSEAPEEEAPNVVRNAAIAILQREKLDMLQQGRDTQSDKADTA